MNQSSAKSPVVILLLVAALFIAMDRIVQAAPLADWWLVGVLLLVALFVALPDRFMRRSANTSTKEEAPAASSAVMHVYKPTPPPSSPTYPPPPSIHADMEDDYGRIRDTEVRSDVMASATHMGTPEAIENEGMVENVMTAGASGQQHEVDEIAGAPAKSVDRSATQEMRIASAKPDDLKKIEGIGPKMATALHTYGIMTFSQLAKTPIPELETAIQDAGMRFAPSMPTWAEQAAYAARGDWDGLKTFQATLKGGRRT